MEYTRAINILKEHLSHCCVLCHDAIRVGAEDMHKLFTAPPSIFDASTAYLPNE